MMNDTDKPRANIIRAVRSVKMPEHVTICVQDQELPGTSRAVVIAVRSLQLTNEVVTENSEVQRNYLARARSMSRLSEIDVWSYSGQHAAQVVTPAPGASVSVSRTGAGTKAALTPGVHLSRTGAGVSHDTEIFNSDTSSVNSEINFRPSDTSDDKYTSDNDNDNNNEPAAKAKRAYRTKYIREQEKREERGTGDTTTTGLSTTARDPA